MKCPKCGLTNPDDAMWCDCGYDFEKQRMRVPAPGSAPPAKRLSWKRRLLWTLAGGVLAFFFLHWWHSQSSLPPQSVIDEAIPTAGIFGCSHPDYTVRNKYDRHVQDEVFHVYEFNVVCSRDKESAQLRGEETRYQRIAIGFVKRGNEWHWAKWNETVP